MILATPSKIRNLQVRNRTVFPAMLLNYATDRGEVSQRLVDFHRRMAAGGFGVLVTECVFPQFKGGIATRGMALYDSRFLPGLRRLTDAVHEEGALLNVQVFFDGAGRVFASDETVSIGPSDLAAVGGPSMRPLTADEIDRMATDFGAASRLAVQAGADMVEIHMAHAHLLGRFLSPYWNRREDEFGGSPDGRLRFPLMVVDRVRSQVGEDVPISVRLSLSERLDGGLELEDSIEILKVLKKRTVDAVHVTVGQGTNAAGRASIGPTAWSPQAPFAELAKTARQATGMTTIFAGKVLSPAKAEELLSGGVADFVSIGRGGLSDPDWPNKAIGVTADPIVPCISCNVCFDDLIGRREVACTVNPFLGFEGDLRSVRPLSNGARYAIIGGGIAGMVLGLTLAGRGGRVAIYEQDDELGGQYRWSSVAPGKKQFADYLIYLRDRVATSRIEVITGRSAREDDVADILPEHMYFAGGAVPADWTLTGEASCPVARGWYAFNEFADLAPAKVTVVGAGQVGSDVSLWLASRGHHVTLIDRAQNPMVARGNLSFDYERTLGELGVQLLTSYEAISVSRGEVQCRRTDGTEHHVQAEALVNAVGRLPRSRPRFLTRAIGVGDCLKPGRAADAVRQAGLQGAWSA
jgi:2,4-dienoyl-CoA reductase-like NADH-dependent reductase (Old Yellow Enzyme family)